MNSWKPGPAHRIAFALLGGLLLAPTFAMAADTPPDVEVLYSWRESAVVDGATVLLTGEQVRAADTGEELTLYFLPSGEPAPEDFTASNQRAWATGPDEIEAALRPFDPANDRAAATLARPLAVSPDAADLSVDFPWLDPAALEKQAADAASSRDAAGEKSLVQIGVVRQAESPLALSAAAPAPWRDAPDGGRVLVVQINASGALGLRVHLTDLQLPGGASFLLYNPDAPDDEVFGPVDAQTLDGATEFWTATVFASRAHLEFRVPAGSDPDAVAFRLAEILHLYRAPFAEFFGAVDTSTDLSTDAAPASLPIEKVGTCHSDISCYSTWKTPGKSVAMISFVEGGGGYLCSGCLMNDKDAGSWINYFLTANHCVDSSTVASTIEFYWFYETSECNGTAPSRSWVPRTTGGATLLATMSDSAGTDFTFLRMRNNPPSGVVYAGWNVAQPGSAETLVAIHHPEGSHKRIALGSKVSSDSRFWTVRWNRGVTEGGSSGSPLLNASQQVIGQLWGGYSSCENPSGIDRYGRFDVTYPIVRTWLDPATNPAVVKEISKIHFASERFSDLACAMEMTDWATDQGRTFDLRVDLDRANPGGVAGWAVVDGIPEHGSTAATLLGGRVAWSSRYNRAEIRFRATGRDPVTRESYSLTITGYRSGNTLVIDPLRSKLIVRCQTPKSHSRWTALAGAIDIDNPNTTVAIDGLTFYPADTRGALFRTSAGWMTLPWGETVGIATTGGVERRSTRRLRDGSTQQRRTYTLKAWPSRAGTLSLTTEWFDSFTATGLPIQTLRFRTYNASAIYSLRGNSTIWPTLDYKTPEDPITE